MKKFELRSGSIEQTQAIGEKLALAVIPGDVIDLRGPLGAGKTAFTQGFARGLGVKGSVTSPTFLMVKSYSGRLDLLHCDLYRTSSSVEVEMLGIDEELDAGAVAVVEWGERAEGELDAVVVVDFSVPKQDPGSRVLEFTLRNGSQDRFESMWSHLEVQ
ncbi:MAG: tRNA (adenosine(37)-N6)-threonylcarbamoyltransferase complex ATPase subunit type 1 TsaE [Acidimicrobiaceae bacterium]|nr:tRNA (adenosine(37)-N6)-threonylcarbamoyltransferase complex ATPase subunit type 1 TsaE [Acidimicrobiaceae bacterium]